MQKIIFIADFFINEILGGAELCNEELIKLLQGNGYSVEQKKCPFVSPKFLIDNKDCFFFVANFMTLSDETKKAFKNYEYAIIEHDHKYCQSNNPSKFSNLLVPEEQLQNQDFYRNARAVFCQSKLHADTVQKNLLLKNIINVGCNLWSDDDLTSLEKNLNKPKIRKYGIIETNNPNKGMLSAVKYCRDKNLHFEMISLCKSSKFIEELAKTETLIFFPQWMETYSRIAVEARILGTKLITNKWIGAASEPYFSKTGSELLSYIKMMKNEFASKYMEVIEGSHSRRFMPEIKLPKLSIITSVYNGEKFIESFLEDITKQTIFQDCELIILNANSPQNEDKYILPYLEKFNNIVYKRLDKRISVQESMNLGVKLAAGEYLTIANVDDRRHPECLELLLKHLVFDPAVDLVYCDCLVTPSANETFQFNTANHMLYEHSMMEFSPENMIKCLPGPIPLWRKSMHDKYGMFDETLKYAGDWEMWLRAVKHGSKFKKVNKVLGLYYFNPEGLSTAKSNHEERLKEESVIFSNFRGVIGTENFNKFKGHFKVE